jgi:hypothetical protein
MENIMSLTDIPIDQLQHLADEVNASEGDLLECKKGKWTINGIPCATEFDGIRLALFLQTVKTGNQLWKDKRVVERNVGLVTDGFRPVKCQPGESVYVDVLGAIVNDKGVEGVATFRSGSWGAWYAITSLIKAFCTRGRQSVPICTLDTKPRGDENGTIDPAFRVIGWWSPGVFEERLGLVLTPPAESPMIAAPMPADFDDDLPEDLGGVPAKSTKKA